MYWRPPPEPRAQPSENNGRSLLSIPPRGDSTSPVRVSTTRAPACCAGAVAASQSRHKLAEKPAARRSGLVGDPVAGVAVVTDGAGVDQHADGPRRHRFGQHLGGIDPAVAQALLERTRPPLAPTLTPHMFTAASTPRRAFASNSPVSGFQNSSSEFEGARRTMRTTRWSVARSA
jgi:hypothetical protein